MDSKKKIRRSRNGCHNCKRLKIKCDEQKPSCSYCLKTGTDCDYSIKLTWGGRPYKDVSKRRKDPYSTPIVFNNSTLPKSKTETTTINLPAEDVLGVKFIESSASLDSNSPTPINLISTTTSLNSSYSNFTSFNLSPSNSLKRINDSNEQENKVQKRRLVELTNESISPPAMRSPPSFLTPGGDSILSDVVLPKTNDYQYTDSVNVSATISIPRNQTENRENSARDEYIKQEADDFNNQQQEQIPTPIFLENIPDISNGIESLSNALERITNGGQQFHLQNSGIFNNFVLSSMDIDSPKLSGTDLERQSQTIKKGEISDVDIELDPSKDTEERFLGNYSEDLARIEAYMPTRSPNYVGDLLSPSIMTHKWIQSSSNRLEDLDDDELDEPLDSEIATINTLPYDHAQPHIITPEELFTSIPPMITPFPEILLQVPFYRNLMHFWVHVASEHLVPAPAHVYTDNPFKVLLPQMAMHYPSILTTLLAFSAKLRSNLISSNDTPSIVTDQLLARSCTELLRLLKDSKSATSNETLATVLLLSCYEVFHSKDFNRHRAHTIGARQIILARNSKSRRNSNESNRIDENQHHSNSGTESDIAFFLMRWFVYVDVIGALSATRNSHNYLSFKDDLNAYVPAESVATINEIERLEQSVMNPKRDIDHLLGFDVKFLPHFTEVALLIRKTNAYIEECDGNLTELPIEIITQALECKEKLTKAYELGEKRRQKKLDKIIDYKIQKKKASTNSNSPPNLSNLIEQDNILRCTNKSFCDMGILNLYRRALKIPRESQIIQDLANGIGLIARENLESQSPADICTIFCSFSAGCETLDQDMREFFRQRFTKLIEMGNVNALKSLQIMTRCWETGEDWIVASRILDIDIALL